MDAVLILSTTWNLILERDIIPEAEVGAVKRYYLDQDYVIITNDIDEKGNLVPYKVLPIYVFSKYYEFDPVAVQHDWDSVVKPFPDDEAYRLPYKE